MSKPLSSRFRVALLLPVFLVFLCTAKAFLAQETKPPDTPEGVVHAALKAIDANYLAAQKNPLWNISQDALLKGKYKDTSQAFQAIQKQLPYMQDSELNLLTPEEIKAVQAEALGQKVGIGLGDFCVDQQIETGRARVVTPLVGSPAMKAGLLPGDVIVSIDGKATSEMSHEQVMDALRSAGDGGIKLSIERGERTLTHVLQPSPEKIEVLRSSLKRVAGKNVGYIRIALFTPDAAQMAREAVSKLEQEGVDGYVLDLRNDPGGFLNSARDVAGLFATGTLGYKTPSNNQKEAMEAKGPPLTTKPLAVLINAGTASASEFLSAALQGLHRGTLVGEGSYGRGRAQIFVPLAEGYGLQIPAVQLLTPGEKEIAGKGILPDIPVKQMQLMDSQYAGPGDHQFLRAAQSLNAQR